MSTLTRQGRTPKEPIFQNLKLLAIDPWWQDGGWGWGRYHVLEDSISLTKSELSQEKVCKWLRDKNFLTKQSKGMLKVDSIISERGVLIEVREAFSNKPIFALSNMH